MINNQQMAEPLKQGL
jgi:hypothetical protein